MCLHSCALDTVAQQDPIYSPVLERWSSSTRVRRFITGAFVCYSAANDVRTREFTGGEVYFGGAVVTSHLITAFLLLHPIFQRFSSSTVVTAIINQTSALQRARPQFIPVILGTWASFIKPSPPPHFTPLQIKFIDKAIRIQLLSISK